MSYSVGQILFVILKKQASVFPMQVVEEITKKTLNGEETSYILRAGSDPTKTLNISEIDGEIFDSAENAKKTLVDRVTRAVSSRVDEAIAKAKEWYPSGFEHASDDPLSLIKKTGAQEQAPVPQQHQPQRKQQASSMVKQEVAELAQELRAESDSLVMEVPDENGVPQKVKVKGLKLPPELS